MGRGSAVITGASSGIGEELARLCAADGFDLILIARRVEALERLADELRGKHRIDVRVLTADLADSGAPGEIVRQIGAQPVDILINNAGFGVHGPFAQTDWQEERRLIEVNMIALTHLTKLLLPGMLARRSGRVLNVASTAAFVPGPLMAMYYASKAFVFSLSLALANEVEGSGVTVTVLCPGPTRTEFDQVAKISGSRLFRGSAMSAADVAREGYDAMMAGKAEIIAGARNRWMILGARLAPRSLLAKATRRLNSTAE